MDHSSHRDRIEREEVALAGFPLDHARLFRLGSALFEHAPAPVAVRIVVARRTVLHMAMDGTAGDNDHFLDLKIGTVFATGHASLWWHHNLRAGGRQMKDLGWARVDRVIDYGGGFPLRMAGVLVGAVAVSGLTHEEDHDLIVRCMMERLAGEETAAPAAHTSIR